MSSLAHELEHPSSLFVLPSSHSSPGSTTPSPHTEPEGVAVGVGTTGV